MDIKRRKQQIKRKIIKRVLQAITTISQAVWACGMLYMALFVASVVVEQVEQGTAIGHLFWWLMIPASIYALFKI